MGLGIEHRRVTVAVGERLGDGTLGQASHLVEHLAGRIGVQVGVVAGPEGLVQPEDVEQVKDLVTDIALVVAHFSSL